MFNRLRRIETKKKKDKKVLQTKDDVIGVHGWVDFPYPTMRTLFDVRSNQLTPVPSSTPVTLVYFFTPFCFLGS